MKTNNITKRSFLTGMILMATAMFSAMPRFSGIKNISSSGYHTGGGFWNQQAIYIPRRRKLKGWQKENRKYRTNKTK